MFLKFKTAVPESTSSLSDLKNIVQIQMQQLSNRLESQFIFKKPRVPDHV